MQLIEKILTPINEIHILSGHNRFVIVLIKQDGTEIERVISVRDLAYYHSVEEWADDYDH